MSAKPAATETRLAIARRRDGAYLKLERALQEAYLSAWHRLWARHSEAIQDAVRRRDWARAHEAADRLDLTGIANGLHGPATKFGGAALLQGVARARGRNVTASLDRAAVKNAAQHLRVILGRNGTQFLRERLHAALTRAQQEIEEATVFKVDLTGHKISRLPADWRQRIKQGPKIEVRVDARTRARVEGIGDAFLALGASVHLNRLRNYGFLLEAAQQGVDSYEVSAILDERTSKVCRVMDGRVFRVEDGYLQASAVMAAEDPDDIKAIAPWPRQDKQTIAQLESASIEDLVSWGLSVPPYHPFCRTVCVPFGETAEGINEVRDYTPSGIDNLFREAEAAADEMVSALYRGVERADTLRAVDWLGRPEQPGAVQAEIGRFDD